MKRFARFQPFSLRQVQLYVCTTVPAPRYGTYVPYKARVNSACGVGAKKERRVLQSSVFFSLLLPFTTTDKCLRSVCGSVCRAVLQIYSLVASLPFPLRDTHTHTHTHTGVPTYYKVPFTAEWSLTHSSLPFFPFHVCLSVWVCKFSSISFSPSPSPSPMLLLHVVSMCARRNFVREKEREIFS